LLKLHKKGCKTWVSMEPYPTPNIVKQDLMSILNKVSYVDKIIFGRLHYNKLVAAYKGYQAFYDDSVDIVVNFCQHKDIDYHIKARTLVES
ncbi:MAG: radical SAM protein, partial [Candidatus Cloacimonetes bacterium]|nr:radical SAM protein [Candidatus Cloacimonadota bacterium]